MIELIKNKGMKDLGMIPLTSLLVKKGTTAKQYGVSKEKYVRDGLEKDPNFECWDFLNYHSYKTGISICTTSILVSNTGNIAYELADGTCIDVGDERDGRLVVSIEPLLIDTPLDIHLDRAVACTFLAVPDMFHDLYTSILDIKHLDGNKLNPHFLNLEWAKD